MENIGQINFGNSGTYFDRAWDNSVWDEKAKDYLMLANINTQNGDISWWVDKPNNEQKKAVEKYASKFVDDDLLLLELEAEAVLVLQKQAVTKSKNVDQGKQDSIYEKAISELKYNQEESFCKIIENDLKREISEDEKQKYVAMLVNDTSNKVKLKAGNKVLKDEYKFQPVFPPSIKVAEPKDLSLRGKVVAMAKYSATRKDEYHEIYGYVYHDMRYLVATDAHQLVVVHVKEMRDDKYYAFDGGMSFPNGKFPKYRSVIPKRIKNNNILDLKQLIEQVKGVDKANSFFNKKTNKLPAVKLLFKENGKMLFTSPQITLKALMSLWMTGVTRVDISVSENQSIVFYDVDNDKTLAVVMGLMHDTNTLFTPILGNGIN